ncbi:recombinase RecT [Azospirillum argentinense]
MAHSAIGMTPPAKSVTELRAAGKQTAKQAGGSTVAAFFELNKDAIKAVLPQHMTPDRMLKIALRAMRTTPKLMNCTLDSLFGAVITCAQLGLEPNTPQGHIYLIPFENRRKNVTEVQVVIGYKGLLDLARRSGEIETIAARVAYKGDDFSIEYGTTDSIIHKPKMEGDVGKPLGVYAVAKLKGGGYQFEWMSVAQVNEIRDGSQGYKTAKHFNSDKNPWITNWEEMARKTVIRRLCKYLPMSIELATAAALDGRAEKGMDQGLEHVLDGDFMVLPEDATDEASGEQTAENGEQDAADASPQIESKPEQAMPMPTVDERQAERVETDTSAPAPKSAAQPKAAKPASTTASAPPPPPAEEAMPDLPADDDTDTGSLFSE